MHVDKLILKDSGEEVLAHNDNLFPHSSYYVEPEKFPGGTIPWHWHSDIEVMYVVQGSMSIKTALNEYVISTGDSAFINTNVLHFQQPLGSVKVITLNQVFQASVIYGTINSVFYVKYVSPVLSCNELDIMTFRQDSTIDRKITEFIRLSQDIADEKKPGYEIEVRNALSSMWLLIFEKAAPMLNAKKVTSSHNEDRLKKMMEFIHHNYMDKIELKDIAYSANISEREAIRTFNNILNTSPFAYLIEYRIRMATDALEKTQNPISLIAYDCGFSSLSYFGKEFKKVTGMTALEYRKNHMI